MDTIVERTVVSKGRMIIESCSVTRIRTETQDGEADKRLIETVAIEEFNEDRMQVVTDVIYKDYIKAAERA